MEDVFDLAIIGGGTNGYATFLTAASSGLKTVLLEKDRVGQKANYASLGMIQPGLKYLHSDLDLVKMDALDCRLLRAITGNLLQPQKFILSVFKDYCFPLSNPWFWEVYLRAYDPFSKLALHPGHYWLKEEEKKELQLKFKKELVGGVVFEEWVVDPMQLAQIFISAGKFFGGTVLEQAKVIGFEKTESNPGLLIKSASVQRPGGKVENIKAKYFVNTSGAWTPTIIKLLGISSALQLRPTRGTSVVVGRKLTEKGIIIFDERGKYLVLLPQPNGTLIGPTNYDISPAVAENPDLLRPKNFEMRDLLETVNRYMALETPLSFKDIVKVKCGLRPQINHEGVAPDNISHQFAIFSHQAEGILNFTDICGGKLSTLLRIPKELTELVCRELHRPFEWKIPYLFLSQGKVEIVEKPFCSPADYAKNYALKTAGEIRQNRLKHFRKKSRAVLNLIRHALRK
ncbi:MAG: hypothetical protein A3C71_02980 [Candidatus Yanofskybacteria bacterium RIFCSPHIGHO2_02_FULL_43_15c]|uniref:FAD dependent oxidoreductase domain-containing protein n=2 Tax=Candidatus Yanofskyibacteriota TaxID=1752733 RepID=A0A1F8H468_9BACT|nr:MAG: hypothetical protein A3C71_02980 [Candidatus Yanofskybacteria bacterium RIFCSPHIGHO2_02_FULL_43_15c]OGN32070.1 MAG: hypothetical protein A3I92_00050 [Candidatus Yanofskybacteria bacterium RIFCSPLOWO2_02_FULL_43_10b]